MTDDELRAHLLEEHPCFDVPWFVQHADGEACIQPFLTSAKLDGLHELFHRQGEQHRVAAPVPVVAAVKGVRIKSVPKGPCRRPWCRALAARSDGLCRAHGAEV